MTRDGVERGLRRGGPWVGAAALVVALAALGWRACGREDAAARGDTRFYVRGAERFLAGEDLYWAARQPDGYRPTTGYTYPPPFAAACVWTSLLPYRVLRGVWLLLMTGCALAAGALALRLLAARGPPPARPALALLLALPILLRFGLNDLAHGQTNWLVTLLLAATLLGAAHGRDGRAGVALGTALAIKPTAWPLLAWWLVVERRGRAAAAALAALVGLVLLLPLPRYGPAGTVALLASWVERMRGFALEEAAAPANASLPAALLRCAGAEAGPSALLLARTLALLAGAGAFLGLARWRRTSPAAPAALLALGALLSPVTWKAHLVVLLLPALFATRRLADEARPARAWGLWGLTVALLTLPSEGLLGLGGVEEAGSVALGTALVLAQAAAVPAPAVAAAEEPSAREP